MPDPIHQDYLLANLLTMGYQSFVDEQHRVVPIDLFTTLFIYKYGRHLSDWSMFVDDDNLICRNISKFEYVFPLLKKL